MFLCAIKQDMLCIKIIDKTSYMDDLYVAYLLSQKKCSLWMGSCIILVYGSIVIHKTLDKNAFNNNVIMLYIMYGIRFSCSVVDCLYYLVKGEEGCIKFESSKW